MRRQARQCALQILYQLDVQKQLEGEWRDEAQLDQALQDFWTSFEPLSPADRAFSERLVRGVVADLKEIDEAIMEASRRWKLGRMDKVDRNLIRVAAYEILRCPDIPRAASINEAIELAKRFSGQESAAFINGVLDQLGREDRDKTVTEGECESAKPSDALREP